MTGSAQTLRERNRARTRAEIALAALELFESQGFDNTTVDQIAAQAQISPATFFRYFPAKEDVLFAGQDAASEDLRKRIADRSDKSRNVSALAAPIREYADALVKDNAPTQRLTRLVMTTPSLAPRSLRMRLLWERAAALQLATEAGRESPTLADTAVAGAAVSCLTSALRHWSTSDTRGRLGTLVQKAFKEITES